jgi:hypothetical protein
MSAKQQNWIGWVAQHQSGFATPAHDDGVWIYSYVVAPYIRGVSVEREYAGTMADVRRILGY